MRLDLKLPINRFGDVKITPKTRPRYEPPFINSFRIIERVLKEKIESGKLVRERFHLYDGTPRVTMHTARRITQMEAERKSM